MHRLILAVLMLLTPWQSGEQAIQIPIPQPSFDIGYGSTISQNLKITPASLQEFAPGYTHDGVYLLTFSVANFFPSYPGYYKVEIDFGSQELCETAGWGAKTSVQVTVVCPGPGYIIVDHSLPGDNPGNPGPVQGTQNLELNGTVYGWQLLFTDVSLTFTPIS
jgi:hypothetical protein